MSEVLRPPLPPARSSPAPLLLPGTPPLCAPCASFRIERLRPLIVTSRFVRVPGGAKIDQLSVDVGQSRSALDAGSQLRSAAADRVLSATAASSRAAPPTGRSLAPPPSPIWFQRCVPHRSRSQSAEDATRAQLIPDPCPSSYLFVGWSSSTHLPGCSYV
jgi:hypothetical protein